jgi:porin
MRLTAAKAAVVTEVAPAGKSVVPGKALAEPAAPSKPKLSKQGLYSFNIITYAPDYNNLFPFYFHSGLVYEGLIPTRDKDKLMFVIAYGAYSYDNIKSLQRRGVVNQPNYSIVLEWDYRIQINEWAYFQPFVQYFIQPNGTNAVKNATILGFAYSVVF